MAVTFEAVCSCGAAVSYTGHRRGERAAKDAWDRDHAEHGVAVVVVEVAEPAPAPVVAVPAMVAVKQSRRQQREAAAGA